MLVSPSGETVTSLPKPKPEMLIDCGDCELRELVFYPDERLARRTREVADPTSDEVRKLVGDMAFTMYTMHGVGLSANQVGSDLRVCVIDVAWQMPQRQGQPSAQLLVLINPEVVWNNGVVEYMGEACLSVPSVQAKCARHTEVIVEGVDLRGQPWSLKMGGFLGRVLQHEIDHLDGVTMFDRMKPGHRAKAEGEYHKFQATIQGQIVSDEALESERELEEALEETGLERKEGEEPTTEPQNGPRRRRPRRKKRRR